MMVNNPSKKGRLFPVGHLPFRGWAKNQFRMIYGSQLDVLNTTYSAYPLIMEKLGAKKSKRNLDETCFLVPETFHEANGAFSKDMEPITVQEGPKGPTQSSSVHSI